MNLSRVQCARIECAKTSRGISRYSCARRRWASGRLNLKGKNYFDASYRRRPALSDPLGFVRTCTFQRCTLQIERFHILPSAAQISTSTLVGIYLREQNYVGVCMHAPRGLL
ncbi:hypothetical protein PUN28_013274 [Cardiocondyla obscurior]|uniref:Uncharacterized protein n=1 Tax=Cardiocondyla obscurior TaxID=286306 RepID=A0AAW2FDA8_9HYME